DDTIRPVRMEAARLRKLTARDALSTPTPSGPGSGFDLGPPVQGLVDLARARGTAVELRALAPAWVRGCEVELVGVVENLLANAERHGEPPIVIEITATEGWIELTVTDQGRGIAPEIARHLFHRGATTHPDGHGIGLYRARAAVARHGGALVCRPGAGHRGTSFVLRLPNLAPRAAGTAVR
ncbi:MAG: ATP-binding protein, partial [Acidimicrobiia bacterium]|nr:ATP-binding protein [Acidimicrobiia bacterium]